MIITCFHVIFEIENNFPGAFIAGLDDNNPFFLKSYKFFKGYNLISWKISFSLFLFFGSIISDLMELQATWGAIVFREVPFKLFKYWLFIPLVLFPFIPIFMPYGCS